MLAAHADVDEGKGGSPEGAPDQAAVAAPAAVDPSGGVAHADESALEAECTPVMQTTPSSMDAKPRAQMGTPAQGAAGVKPVHEQGVVQGDALAPGRTASLAAAGGAAAGSAKAAGQAQASATAVTDPGNGVAPVPPPDAGALQAAKAALLAKVEAQQAPAGAGRAPAARRPAAAAGRLQRGKAGGSAAAPAPAAAVRSVPAGSAGPPQVPLVSYSSSAGGVTDSRPRAVDASELQSPGSSRQLRPPLGAREPPGGAGRAQPAAAPAAEAAPLPGNDGAAPAQEAAAAGGAAGEMQEATVQPLALQDDELQRRSGQLRGLLGRVPDGAGGGEAGAEAGSAQARQLGAEGEAGSSHRGAQASEAPEAAVAEDSAGHSSAAGGAAGVTHGGCKLGTCPICGVRKSFLLGCSKW